ncbi:PREDICTED: tRNA-specific adenosine deaminase 1 [Ceratosolen solmsi marchali]|uniref:tRNA-specific adenosine deaminase 1 n=1 Tax=Ceratosolen solmsi marchali TaxID=326594 RepID=A0AAJ7DXB6_9HYME|nr:PREDICTED: tRNA-specific adenosine deaminase 1 [Ceratosolen solmsi marchali]
MGNIDDEVAKLCLDKYASLKKTGKPSENEWTVLSGVVLQKVSKKLCVVSLCTGTKCLSGMELRNTRYEERGDRLSDSHAEILARRAFLRYLYNQIELLIRNQKCDIFYLEDNKVKLNDVSFYFYSSQTPCGDCSIIPKLSNEFDDSASSCKRIKRESIDIEVEYGLKVTDIYRTGAKCVESENRQDPRKDGVNYHLVGPLRTKPGRGDRTLSLSCSDKIAKWNVMGVQGALLSLMIPSIRFERIIIGGGCPYSFESMQRGISRRFDTKIKHPIITQSKLSFESRKHGCLRCKPCPSSIVWCEVPERQIEIAVNGIKQGATKKKKNSSSLLISRKELFKTFLRVYDMLFDAKQLQHPKKIMYFHYKQYSLCYQNLWKDTLKVFHAWPVKPLYLQECLSF